ncbi:hypothetical protein TNCV_2685851 [Trichonephila clavipes]|nr:hypothetical protein TNCV_2685851 [Trichonephila clavipes]
MSLKQVMKKRMHEEPKKCYDWLKNTGSISKKESMHCPDAALSCVITRAELHHENDRRSQNNSVFQQFEILMHVHKTQRQDTSKLSSLTDLKMLIISKKIMFLLP